MISTFLNFIPSKGLWPVGVGLKGNRKADTALWVTQKLRDKFFSKELTSFWVRGLKTIEDKTNPMKSKDVIKF